MKKHKPIFIEFIFHVLFWIVYITYPILIFGKSDCFSLDINKIITTIVSIGFPSYMIYFFLIKNIRNIGYWVVLALLTATLIYFFCTYGCACQLKSCLINKIIELLFVNAIFLAVFVTKRNITNIKLLAKSENERVEAELKALKAQINPHFLFNTLNMLYSDTIAVNEDIADKILKLSDNLHYLIHEGQRKEILIDTEIQFIENYLALQKSRMDDRVNVELHVNLDNHSQMVPPLLIIPFIENAFKYSSMLEEKDVPIFINIKAFEGKITLEVRNKFNHKYREDQKKEWKESGIGIENVKRRLALLFPSKHQISTTEDEDTFLVNLVINTR